MADLVFAGLERLVKGKRFIIGGDWNNSRMFDMTMRKPGQPPISTAFFTRAQDAGWFECHGSKNEEQSFTGDKAQRPYQLDHVFCDAKTAEKMRDCSVRLDWLARELSDHAPVVAEFAWA